LIHLRDAVEAFYRDSEVTDDLLGLRNAVQTAIVVAHAAWQNRQSRGAHYRDDAVEGVASNFGTSPEARAPHGEF
jgi:L-aspartate oxidase